MNKNKKSIVIICISILVIIVICILYINIKNTHYDSRLEGRWTSVDGTLIRVIKEYKYGQPVYANDNIVEYWLDIKKDGKYILYYNDVEDKSRSNFNIEKNLVEKGKWNIDPNNKNIIYFEPDYSNSTISYIWNCKINEDNKIIDCTNYANEFVNDN